MDGAAHQLLLGYMKIPSKSGDHQEQGPRLVLKVHLGLMDPGIQRETAQPPASLTLPAANSSGRGPAHAASLLPGK